MKSVTVGMDLGDKKHQLCVLDADGEILKTCQVTNTLKALEKNFSSYQGATVALEAGSHSPWISRTLESLGCKVLVGNP